MAGEMIGIESIGSESYLLSCGSLILEIFTTGSFGQVKKEKEKEREKEHKRGKQTTDFTLQYTVIFSWK